MKNQDRAVNPCHTTIVHNEGETKREKAFWQVYSAMIGNSAQHYDKLAIEAITAVNAGFKALESDNE